MRFEKYFQPGSVEECCALLKEYAGSARVLAGGTDLVPRLKLGLLKPTAVIGMMDIPGIDEITLSGEGLTLGTLANLRKISLDSRLDQDYLVVKEACGHVSSLQVRNIATIGGNACNANPSADAIHALREASLPRRGPGRFPSWTSSPAPARTPWSRGNCW